jgi:two-component system response regulator
MDQELPSILLVDDSMDDYRAMVRSCEKAHLHNPIQWCKSGQSALDLLRNEGINRPALILLDLNMPGMDGRNLLAIIKKDPELKKIPVIILTTSDHVEDIDYCYSLGASTYIQKPVEFDSLIEAVKRLKDYWFGLAILPKDMLTV